jgi:hypothetical protein
VARLFGYLASALPGIQTFGSSLMALLTASPTSHSFLSASSSLKSTKQEQRDHRLCCYQAYTAGNKIAVQFVPSQQLHAVLETPGRVENLSQ